jgi:hypothetical protein
MSQNAVDQLRPEGGVLFHDLDGAGRVSGLSALIEGCVQEASLAKHSSAASSPG